MAEEKVGTYRITHVTPLYRGWRNLLLLTIRLPDGREMTREVFENTEAAAVLPYDPVRRTAILVRQFRAPVAHKGFEATVLEAVAGLLDGTDPETCVRREAMEEAGIRLSALEPVGTSWSSPGATTERLHLFLAPYALADRVAEGGGLADEHEDIEVVEIGLDDLAGMVRDNAIEDLKTLSLAQALLIRHPALFGSVGDHT
ncbi:NUDIX domain-containing protein [Microvirga terricola]|uniref:GDP-mannose pyrophosphatase n=1 Tax=Microvirga terricola TaxID=2719797 RepID=A0ABX0VD55_9HYPH|nr:NUDIX domain-containing protein [Microvirga terricola]NIX75777.1 NUDIX domain-containing protein [Microvirga terricola]